MENSKMSRIAKNLDICVNVGGKITGSAVIVCVVVAVMTLIFGDKMFASGAVTLSLDFIKFHLHDGVFVNGTFAKLYVFVGTLGGAVICFLIYRISKLIRKILAPMKNGRPFEAGIAENLRRIGWIVLIGGFLSELVSMIAGILLVKAYSMESLFTSEAIAKTEFMFTMKFDFLLLACVIFFLSYIFTYGQQLQQDSDETL